MPAPSAQAQFMNQSAPAAMQGPGLASADDRGLNNGKAGRRPAPPRGPQSKLHTPDEIIDNLKGGRAVIRQKYSALELLQQTGALLAAGQQKEAKCRPGPATAALIKATHPGMNLGKEYEHVKPAGVKTREHHQLVEFEQRKEDREKMAAVQPTAVISQEQQIPRAGTQLEQRKWDDQFALTQARVQASKPVQRPAMVPRSTVGPTPVPYPNPAAPQLNPARVSSVPAGTTAPQAYGNRAALMLQQQRTAPLTADQILARGEQVRNAQRYNQRPTGAPRPAVSGEQAQRSLDRFRGYLSGRETEQLRRAQEMLQSGDPQQQQTAQQIIGGIDRIHNGPQKAASEDMSERCPTCTKDLTDCECACEDCGKYPCACGKEKEASEYWRLPRFKG